MWIILGLLLFGILTGFLLSGFRAVNKIADVFVQYIIFILLFFMGVSIGMNREIADNIGEIGLYSFFITALSISGSILLAKLIFRFFFRKDEK